MDKKQFAIKIENLVPTLVDIDAKIPCDNDGYSINFAFDEEWANYRVKTGIFVCGGATHTSVFEGNVCKIPRIKDGTRCYIGVVTGEITEENAIPDKKTSRWCEVEAVPTITSIADEPSAPSPDVYTEFMALLNKYITEGGGGGGLTEDEVKAIVATETEGKVDKIKPPDYSMDYVYSTRYAIDDEGVDAEIQHNLIPVSEQSDAYTIAIRKNGGRLSVGTAEADADAVNKRHLEDYAVSVKQFKEVTAPIADNTKRIENLESTLLTFIEDTTTAYEKDVPVGVGKNAVLSSIGGVTKTSKNFLDPSLFGFPVNEDGSFRFTADYGEGSGGHYNFATISLSAGTYYLSYKEANIDGELYSEGYGFFVDDVIIGSSIVLDKQTDCVVCFVGGGIGEISADLYVMLSTDPNAEFEPYFEGERYGKVTAIESISPQLLDPSKLEVGYYDVATGKLQVAQNFRSFRTPLKAGEYTISSDIPLKLIRRLEGDTVLNDGSVTPFTFTVEEDSNFGFSFRVDDGATGNIADAKIMLNRGKEAMPYEEIGTVNSTFTIPQEIQAINGYGKDGFVLDFESKTATYEGKVTDVSAYLTGYDKFKALYVQGGGKVRFVSADKLPVPSEITYVKAKE